MDLRKHDRISAHYSGSFSGGVLRGTGVIVDLSLAGCRILSASSVKAGQLLGIIIEPTGSVDSLYITRALVRWVNGHEFGMEFLLMDLRDRQRLDQWCSRPHGMAVPGVCMGRVS